MPRSARKESGYGIYHVMMRGINRQITLRHQKTSETMVCLRGKLRVEYCDELERACTDSFVIEPGGTNVAVSIPIGVWHTVHALESGTCILEMKNGAYEPLGEEDILK